MIFDFGSGRLQALLQSARLRLQARPQRQSRIEAGLFRGEAQRGQASAKPTAAAVTTLARHDRHSHRAKGPQLKRKASLLAGLSSQGCGVCDLQGRA